MAASAHLIWPEIVGKGSWQDRRQTPVFGDPNWANWVSLIIDDDGEPVLRALGCGALLAYWTEGLPAEAIQWASPPELLSAAQNLAAFIRTHDDSIRELVLLYEDLAGRSKPAPELLIEDLEVVAGMARWLEATGKTNGAFELAF